MDCSLFQQRLEGMLDGETPAESLEAHAAQCADCHERLTAAREFGGELRRALAGERAAAAAFADRMEQRFLMHSLTSHELPAGQLGASPQSAPQTVGGAGGFSLRRLSTWLAAMAAGYLLAALTLPWLNAPPATAPGEPTAIVPQAEPASPIATLVVATGQVAVRPAASQAWASVAPTAAPVGCLPGASVRTEAGVRCELQTADGCVVRLNDSSEVVLRSGRHLELKQGQVWCSAPDGVVMEVAAPTDLGPASGHCWSFQCPPDSALSSAVQPGGAVRLSAAGGAVEVQSGAQRRRVGPGQTIQLAQTGFAALPEYEDALLAGAWMDALLVRKGPTNPELLARVDGLLAQIGRAKASYLYEQELRALGEHCVLPLLRFVQTPAQGDQQAQRRMAMRIVADLAPSWAVGDLIPLLADSDDEVRFAAAAALRRLTGQDHGREPAGWRSPWSDCTPTYTAWQEWWQANRTRYPAPEFAKDLPRPAPVELKKS